MGSRTAQQNRQDFIFWFTINNTVKKGRTALGWLMLYAWDVCCVVLCCHGCCLLIREKKSKGDADANAKDDTTMDDEHADEDEVAKREEEMREGSKSTMQRIPPGR